MDSILTRENHSHRFAGERRTSFRSALPYRLQVAVDKEESADFGIRKGPRRANLSEAILISDFRNAALARRHLISDLGNCERGVHGVLFPNSEERYRIEECRFRKSDSSIDYVRFPFSEKTNRKTESRIRKADIRKEKSLFFNLFSVILNHLSESLNRFSAFINRFSFFGLKIADFSFPKSFFADFLHLSDFSFTTSGIRHRKHDFFLPISEIRYHPWRGI